MLRSVTLAHSAAEAANERAAARMQARAASVSVVLFLVRAASMCSAAIEYGVTLLSSRSQKYAQAVTITAHMNRSMPFR